MDRWDLQLGAKEVAVGTRRTKHDVQGVQSNGTRVIVRTNGAANPSPGSLLFCCDVPSFCSTPLADTVSFVFLPVVEHEWGSDAKVTEWEEHEEEDG